MAGRSTLTVLRGLKRHLLHRRNHSGIRCRSTLTVLRGLKRITSRYVRNRRLSRSTLTVLRGLKRLPGSW